VVVELCWLLVLSTVLVGPKLWIGVEAGIVKLPYPIEATAGGDWEVAFEHRVCRRETATTPSDVNVDPSPPRVRDWRRWSSR